jgi:hypothetical protein
MVPGNAVMYHVHYGLTVNGLSVLSLVMVGFKHELLYVRTTMLVNVYLMINQLPARRVLMYHALNGLPVNGQNAQNCVMVVLKHEL